MNSGLRTGFIISVALALIAVQGCSSSDNGSSTEDASSSGSVAGVIAGAENGSTGGGTQALNQRRAVDRLMAEIDLVSRAEASNACPTYTSADFTACLAGSAQSPLTLSDCSYGSSTAVWNGGVSLVCASGSVTRVVSNSTTRVGAGGLTVTIDTSGISDYAGVTVSGSGTTWSPGSLTINGVELVGRRGGLETFDHTITSSAITRSASGGTVTYNGSVTLYHNLVRVTATSQVSNLTLSPGSCCMPTGGTITTTFTTATTGSKFNGATETLTFSSCGTATYAGPDGTAGTVTVGNCI